MMHGSIWSILFFVAALKTVTGTEKRIYAQVGHEVTLRAPAHDSKYKYWYFDKDDLQLAWINPLGGKGTTSVEPWKTQLSLSGDSLVIRGIQDANFGTYFYKENHPTVTVVTYKLCKLTVTVTPASILLPGDKVSLNCNVEIRQGDKRPDIYWQTPLGEKKGVQVNVAEATSKDSGEYTCVVDNERKVKIFITVVDFSPTPQLQYTSTISQLNIPFSIRSDDSWNEIKPMIKEIQWSFTPNTTSNQSPQKLLSLTLDPQNFTVNQDKQLIHSEKLGDFSLSRDRAKEADQGVYKCSITFKKGKTLTRTVKVEVLQIIPFPGATLTSGQKLELHCTTGAPLPPDVQLKWSHSGRALPQTKNISTPLIIKEVQIEDGGLWKCELWRSNTQLTSAVIKLKIEPVLSVWMLVTICSAAAIIILLILLAIILCSRRKRNGRHVRHRLCRCENPKPKGFYRT